MTIKEIARDTPYRTPQSGIESDYCRGTAWSDLAGSSHVWCTLGICSDCYE